MNLLLLAGNSLRNKQWIHEARDHLAQPFDTAYVHEYTHWESGADFIDLDFELEQLMTAVRPLRQFATFAKSMGSVLALRCIAENAIMPTCMLIVGLPLQEINRRGIPVNEWLRVSPIPILIVQNEDDPLGSFEQVLSYVGTCQNELIQVASVPGDTHDYEDYDTLQDMLAYISNS